VRLQNPALRESPNMDGRSFLKVETARNSATSARDWLPVLNRYRAPSHVRSVIELLVTAIPFVLLWVGA
jgi:omega-6 fatty acid desaturase (delta-12 desaturase)